jgi:hypothetical protein
MAVLNDLLTVSYQPRGLGGPLNGIFGAPLQPDWSGAPALIPVGMPPRTPPGGAPAPEVPVMPEWRRPPEMLQPLAGASAPMQPGASLATTWTPAVERDERLLPAPTSRGAGGPQPAPAPPPVSQVPGVSLAGELPTQPSQTAADALLRPAPQQSPLAGALSGLSPQQRTAAMLHVIKGDWGEVAKMLTDTPQAREARTAADERGKALGQAQASLPQALQSGLSMLGNIDAVLGDTNLPWVTGWQAGSVFNPMTHITNIPNLGSGPELRDTHARLQQVQGQAFLQAFQALKGGGAISEQEGARAQAALTRLADLGQSDTGYQRALFDARREIWDLVNLARSRAGLAPVPYQPHAAEGATQAPPPPPGSDGFSIRKIN